MSTWQELKNNPRLKKIFDARCEIIKLTREFFWQNNFKETDTPLAVRLPGQEPYLNPVNIKFHDPNGVGHDFFLHTSPEFALKKLLAAGYTKIFSLCKCFRDYESFGGLHNPEFTMLEFYRAPGSYVDFMNDIENLFKFIGEKINIQELIYKNIKIKINQPWQRLSMREVWQKYVGVDLNDYLDSKNLANLSTNLGYKPGENDEYEDLFYRIFLNKIEPFLGVEAPVFVYNYPAQMCSLSQISKSDSRYAERVELYIGGAELANGFGELTDANKQKELLQRDLELRKKLGKQIWPIDEDFIAALESGIPNTGGVALGVDRMVLLFTGARDLNEVIFQSVSDQLNSN